MTEKPTMLITGGNGQLARSLAEVLSSSYAISAFPHESLDITNREAVAKAVTEVKPTVVLNTAAFTDVDACELDREAAFSINAVGARNVAEETARCGARLVHFSTDFVFDGTSEQPYVETDRPNPKTVYGWSKLEGERLVAVAFPKALIVRVAWLYSPFKRNFVTSIVRQVGEDRKRALQVVEDQFGCPTWTHDVALQITHVLSRDMSGVLHMAAQPEASRYEFAVALLGELGLDVPVRPCVSTDLQSRTLRPRRSSVENARLKSLGIDVMPTWRAGLRAFVAQHRKDLL